MPHDDLGPLAFEDEDLPQVKVHLRMSFKLKADQLISLQELGLFFSQKAGYVQTLGYVEPELRETPDSSVSQSKQEDSVSPFKKPSILYMKSVTMVTDSAQFNSKNILLIAKEKFKYGSSLRTALSRFLSVERLHNNMFEGSWTSGMS